MSGDYSRKRFNPENHYQGVLRQQGRVDLDADWNEYVDLQDRRWRAESIDVIGSCGVPSETPDGFKIQGPVPDLTIGQGRIYVDGLLAENHGANPQFNSALEEVYGTGPIPLTEQPYGGTVVAVTNGSLVYLDVWRREVTHLQEPELIEPAVNVDTTTRYQTAWQVKILADIASDVTCQTPITEIANWPLENLTSAARLTTATVAVTTATDPCLVPPSGGYRGLENHLYRVEVHSYDPAARIARVKWSRENANVAASVLEILNGGTTIRVDSLGRDDVLRFKNGDWAEITSDGDEFAGKSGVMRQVTVDDANQTLSVAALDPSVFPDGVVSAADHLRVIRWDQSGSVRKPDGTELINLDAATDGLIILTDANPSFVLEQGIQVTLSVLAGGSALTGDYWCFAARTADADIERLDQVPPLGVHHHYCKLAIINADGVVHDCRRVYPAITELTSLFYVSGDGQETLPGQTLPKPIQAGVANGDRPVPGALVRFHVTAGNGSLAAGASSGTDIDVVTDSLGVASCVWTLDAANQSQQVEAMLADGLHLPVRFNATLSQTRGAEPGIHVRKITVAGRPLINDTEVGVAELTSGITIICDDNPFQGSIRNKPVCFVTLEMPFPLNNADIQLWGGSPVVGYQPLILAADIDSEQESILWQVTPETKLWLETSLFKVMAAQKRVPNRLLARLTLKGNSIWSEKNPELYLDGEVFGISPSVGAVTAVRFPSGDGQRGGDLEMWFWLIEGRVADVSVTIDPSVAKVAPGTQVDFTVAVEGTTDKTVEMSLVPANAGTIKPSPDKPNAWTYTAPTIALLKHVSVIAKSNADPTKTATAEIDIGRDQQDIAVTITPADAVLGPRKSQGFQVTVLGGDSTKVDVSHSPAVGTITMQEPGLLEYTAPEAIPNRLVVKITVTSQEDQTKSATAQVMLTPVINSQPEPQNSEAPAGAENRGGPTGGAMVKRSKRAPSTTAKKIKRES